MDQYSSTPKGVLKPRRLDSSPVFFTGLTNKTVNTQSETGLLCKLCNGNLTDTSSGDLCSDCIAIPVEISNQINQSSSSKSSSSCSPENLNHSSFSSTEEKQKSLLNSPVFNYNSNSDSQNDSIAFAIQSLKNTDIKVFEKLLQTPIRENNELKSKSSWRERQEARSKASPYFHTPSSNQKSNTKKFSQPLLHTPSPKNGEFAFGQNPQRNVATDFNTSPSSNWSTPTYKPSEKLSEEIWRIFHENKQTEEVKNRKMVLRNTLHDILRKQFNCALYVVGSSMTGLGANSSDIDMCLMLTDAEIDQQKEAVKILHDVRVLFQQYKFMYRIQVIPAKVPILKFTDSVSGVEVDLNINNAIGIRNTQLLSSYARIDRRVAPLVILAKLWARHHGINDAKNNSLSSYSIVLMVIHFLQYRCRPPVVPCLQHLQPDKFDPNSDVRKLKPCEDLPNFISQNDKDLGDLFLGFLKYFSEEFNYYSNVISVRLGRVIPKDVAKYNSSPKNKEAHWQYVCIEEPFDLTNTARSVFNEKVFKYIQFVFQSSWNRLKNNPDLNRLFSCLTGIP